MGDTPDSTSGDGAAGGGWWAGSWIGRHWRGELPLAKAFWLNGCLLNVASAVVGLEVDLLMSPSGDLPHWFLRVVVALIALMGVPLPIMGLPHSLPPDPGEVIVPAMVLAAMIWQVVGIWRSAGRYPGWWPDEGRDLNASSRRVFMIAARVVVALWVLLRLNLVQWTQA